MHRFFIQNFGCRATQADGAALEGLLGREGMESAAGPADADLVILNTCTVTATADEDVRSSIRRVQRANPDAKILVTGCYAQRAPEELSRICGVTWVVGNSHKTQIPRILQTEPETPYHGQIHVGDIFAAQEFLSAPIEDAFADRTRPNLKIQDGCNNRCSFCIIPSVRGRSRSMPLDQVIEQVRALGESYAEVVLTGINLGRWGREPQMRLRLSDLLRRILEETSVQRLRLSSVEPMDFSDDLLELMAVSPRIADHVHAPLQSGSDSVLKRMKRRYRIRHYADRMEKAYSLLPWAAFGADVMTGFPGETDAEFEESYRFVENNPFTYLHVFTYSERPGTPAAVAGMAVPIAVRKDRTRRLRELSMRKNLEFRRKLAGRTLSAVTMPGRQALTENYIKVELATPRETNRIVDVVAGPITENGVAEATPFPVLA